ncbi:ABC transporter ATP-binding protein [Kibdelosporangium aridum]|uniref:ABC transporter ATP-binding protein n=1 Tax=Kibdelosporangium aridum TaxID=2030 RepID=A0A428Z0W4_KIBAR|nr:ABC transporter ATP-binding protein [Kibdelosporangium aridum]RSM78134.1 ABC transporter ATP-binding protein [Kibdelosporangium aridum]
MNASCLPRPLADRRRGWFVRLVLVGFGQAGTAVGTGLLTGVFFTRLVAPQQGTWPFVLGAALLACAGTAAWLSRTEVVLAERLGQDYAHAVRLALFSRLAVGPEPARRGSTGVTVLRFVGDLSALRLWASRGLARLAVAVPLAAGCLVTLAVVNHTVGIPVAAVVVCGMGATLLRGHALRETTRQARRRRGQLAARVTDRVAHMPVVRAFGRGEDELRRIDRKGRQLRGAVVARSRVIGTVRGVAELTGAVAVTVALFVAAMTSAPPSIAATAVTIAGVLVVPLRDLARVLEYWQAARVARAKIEPVLTRPLLRTANRLPLRAGPGELRLVGVTVDGVLDDVTAVASPGQVIAVTGTGRSALLSVAAGLRNCDRGRVLLDSQDLAVVTEPDLRRAIGVMGSDLPLLRGTVAENLSYRVPDADPAELERVRELIGFDELLDTRVGDGGSGLPPGQGALLTLARALVGPPRLVVLDEPGAHLDHEVIDRAVARTQCAVLIATPDPDRFDRVDQVWHLEHGRLRV